MVHEPDDLTHRIERLERESRRWRWTAMVLGGLLGIVGLLGATKVGPGPVADEIRARRFVVVDAAGSQRIRLGMDVPAPVQTRVLGGPPHRPASSVPVLRLYDEQGMLRAEMLVREDGAPFLQLRDKEEKVSVLLSLAFDDTPGFAMYGRRSGFGAPRASMAFSFGRDGLPYLELGDKDDKPIFRAP